MKSIVILLFVMVLPFSGTLFAQEHGPVVGGSLSTLYDKIWYYGSEATNSSRAFSNNELQYHVGYAFRQHFAKRWAVDGIALFGSQGINNYKGYGTDTRYDVNGKYLSLGAVLSYECFSNFRVGVGASAAWYVDPLENPDSNLEKKNVIDVPLVARVGYSFKWFEAQFAYKQGMCKLMRIGNVKSREFQLSVFVPIFGK